MNFAATILLALTLAHSAHSWSSNGILLNAPSSSLREWAIRDINEWKDYMKVKPYGAGYNDISFCERGRCATVNVSRDGQITTDGISIEDAFLLLYSVRMADSLRQYKDIDRQFKAEEAALANKPPQRLRGPNGPYRVHDIPQWQKNVNGETHCKQRWIKLQNNWPDKPTVMMHEMMHVATGCDAEKGLHQDIYRMAPALLELMKNNPDVVEWMLGLRPQIPYRAGEFKDNPYLPAPVIDAQN